MELSAVVRTQAEQTTDCTPVFRIGTVEVDLQVQPYIQAGDLDLAPLLRRHARCDWGDFDPSNDRFLPDDHAHKGRLLSIFPINGLHIEVMTEWDCSFTSVRFAH
ncbi:hypothetical protein [Comamonas terrigena]|uniref:hypothetical protein n=1 Tax=Comamonas terrigena TaxID=32013 RepID=UPI0028AD4246|nr:hypothetical protein [Comamonas terrigena]